MKLKLLPLLLLFTFNMLAQDYKGVAYMPSYRMANLSSLNYNLITHVMASFANPDDNGNMSFDYDIDYFVTTVHNNNAKAVVSIGGGGDFSWGSKVVIYENLLKTQASRTSFIAKIMNYLRDHKLDGLDNDIEGNALALSTFNVFSQELGDSIHAQGLEYSAAIGVGGSWGVNYWDDATLHKLDFMMTMSYGGVGSWNWNIKNDDHTFAKMKKDMEFFTVTKNISKDKVIGGIPFYSVEFPSSPQSNYNGYMKTICSIYNDPQFAGQDPIHSDTLYTTGGNPVYINSIQTIQKKMDYCNDFGGGVMIWEAGQDCYDGSVSLLDSMYAYKQAKSLNAMETGVTEVSVYPNPSSGLLTIQTGNSALLNYTVFDALGKALKKGSEQVVLLNKLSPGTYFIRILFSEEQKTLKFILE